MTEKIYLTRAGYEQLLHTLKELENEKLPKNLQRVKRARSFCDFHEDSEYRLAIDEQLDLQARINELRYKLQEAELIDTSSVEKKQVGLGSLVVIQDLEDLGRASYRIVESAEAALDEANISMESPLGQALLGRKLKDKVTVQTPDGPRQVQILSIN